MPRLPRARQAQLSVSCCSICCPRCRCAWYIAITAFVTLAAIWCAGTAEKILGTNDPPQVVIDEVAGQLITLAALPAHWTYMLGGFLLFRLLDIIKPWPANTINRDMHGGTGIVLDDVVAGIYANVILQLVKTIA